MDSDYILSIDPAYSTTGIAVIRKDIYIESAFKFITTKDDKEDLRMMKIINELLRVSKFYNINEIAFEDGFVGANMKTALMLSKLRGGMIASFLLNNYQINYVQPAVIRMNLGCGGHAKKEDVAAMILNMFPDSEVIKAIGPYSDKQNKNKTSDIYDAISIGVSYLMNKGKG